MKFLLTPVIQGDISMIAPVPRRDLFTGAKDSGAPPKLSDGIKTLAPRSTSAFKRLNQLERTCYIGVAAGDSPKESDDALNKEDEATARPVWFGSGFIERKAWDESSAPKLGVVSVCSGSLLPC